MDPQLVLGLDVGYTWLNSLLATSTGSGSGANAAASYKLVGFATMRARAGYAFGQFLPYAFVGGAVSQVNYSTTAVSAGAVVLQDGKNDTYPAGFVAGLGMDVALLPNVFLRGEWKYIAFTSVGDIRSQVNIGRVGIGVRF